MLWIGLTGIIGTAVTLLLVRWWRRFATEVSRLATAGRPGSSGISW